MDHSGIDEKLLDTEDAAPRKKKHYNFKMILAIDYSSNDKEAELFFRTVQNKIHYGVYGYTAAEVIMQRADATKNNMGLITFGGVKVRKKDLDIAKNYLYEDEMQEADMNKYNEIAGLQHYLKIQKQIFEKCA